MIDGFYRGYIASRPIRGQRTAQHVQNLVVRDYARSRQLPFALSAVEYAMPDCHMVLEQILADLPNLGGIVCFSLFMLPSREDQRRAVWSRILDHGCQLHGALETLAVTGPQDIDTIEDLFLADRVLAACPPTLSL